MRNVNRLVDILTKISCDTIINKNDECFLQEWMENNKVFLEQRKEVNEIFHLLENILFTKTISELDKHHLINLLEEIIKENKLEFKLSLLREKIKNQEIVGNELIEILDDSEYIEIIHERAQRQLLKALQSYSKSSIDDKEIIVISLSLIALDSYDGSFYDGVRKEYCHLYAKYSEQKIEGLIRDVLNFYRSPDDKKSTDRIINVVLKNAIVPKYFLASFFDFISDIYKINFSYDLPIDLVEEFKFVYDGIMEYMNSDGDEFKANVTQKTYKLIKTTKELVQKGITNELIDLSISILKLIDKATWQKDVVISNTYFGFGYNKWLNSSLRKDNDTERIVHKNAFYSRWEPRYILKDNCIYLVPPIHRVKGDFKSWEIEIVIKSKERIIKRIENPEIKEIFGGYQISTDMIKIDNPFEEISYSILSGTKTIYDSTDKLHKSFIVFDENGEEIKNNQDYTGNVIICYDKQIENRIPFFECQHYVLISKTVKTGDTILFGDQIFNFSFATKSGIYGEKRVNHLIIDDENNEYIVYKEVKYLVFEDDTKNAVIELIINNEQRKINDFSYSISDLGKSYRYLVDVSLLKTNIYDICVNKLYKGNKKELLNTSFALDKELEIKLMSQDEKYEVSINSELFASPLHIEFDIYEFDIDDVRFVNNKKEYVYRIPFGMKMYRLSNNNWKTIEEDFVIEEIQRESIMEIYGLNIDSAMFMASNGKVIETDVQVFDKGSYKKCYIGKLIEYKREYDYMNVILLLEGKAMGMVRCYFKCLIDDKNTYLDFNQVTGKLTLHARYLGKGPIYYKIQNERNENIFISGKKNNEEPLTINGLKSFRKYNIQICWNDQDDIQHVLYETTQMFYSRKDLVGKAFKLREGYINEKRRQRIVEVKMPLKDCYLYITDRVDDGTFIGQLYSETTRGKYYLHKINPVDIEICTDGIDGRIDIYLTNSGDGLLFDERYSNIMNSLENKYAPDIILYSMDSMPIER